METLPTVCVHCGGGIVDSLTKPGKINECGDCGALTDVERLGGNAIWNHKTAPELEIKPLSEAKRFADKQRRFGAGVTMSLVSSQLSPGEYGEVGANSGAEPGAEYRSNLDEGRSLKR